MTVQKRLVVGWYEDRRLRLLSNLVLGNRVLDLGYAQLPNPYLPSAGRHISGVDIAPPSGRSGYDDEIQSDVMEFKPPLSPYTSVVAGELLEHLERPHDFLRHVRELIVRDGRLILSTPNPFGFPMVLFEAVNSRRRFYSEDHTMCYPPRWVVRMLESSGFTVERLIPVGLWNPLVPIPWCPVSLSYQVIYVASPS